MEAELKQIDERIEAIKEEQRNMYQLVKDFRVDHVSVERYFKFKVRTDKELDKLISQRSALHN